MGELGNTMPLALANLLSSPVLLFTSMETMPVLLITPSEIVDSAAVPRIYLASNQFGAGHYDSIISTGTDNQEREQPDICQDVSEQSHTIHKCSCGKNAKRSRIKKSFCSK
jgi:hypothetical protein